MKTQYKIALAVVGGILIYAAYKLFNKDASNDTIGEVPLTRFSLKSEMVGMGDMYSSYEKSGGKYYLISFGGVVGKSQPKEISEKEFYDAYQRYLKQNKNNKERKYHISEVPNKFVYQPKGGIPMPSTTYTKEGGKFYKYTSNQRDGESVNRSEITESQMTQAYESYLRNKNDKTIYS